ncbi:MAG: trypsin [Rhodobacteraceae bacterium]|nr:trypsin [Paracoccaceae bacterium]MAY43975.1 trypsin [Paracoccaceae bacterium]
MDGAGLGIWTKKKLGAAALCLWAGAAGAGGLPALPEEAHDVWAAVGRVNAVGFRTRGMCSGVLVAPDRVLTAGHCLFRETGQRVAVGDLHFVAGWHRGHARGDRRVVEALLHPLAVEDGRIDPGHDLALLRLESAMDIAPLPLLGRDLVSGPYAVLGYQGSRPHVLGGRFDCDLELRKFSLAMTRCAVEHGASGGPMLGKVGDGWRVVGVVSAIAGDRTLVPRALDWVAEEIGDR